MRTLWKLKTMGHQKCSKHRGSLMAIQYRETRGTPNYDSKTYRYRTEVSVQSGVMVGDTSVSGLVLYPF